MMEKYFANYTQSLALKELGFNEICFATFDSDKWFDIQDFGQNYDTFPSHIIAAPLKSQVFEWFRKQHKLKGFVEPVEYLDDTPETYMWVVYNECHSGAEQLTYEEAESACIDKLIELLQHDK